MKIEAKHTSSKSGLFLMELVIAILFFSLASAVCIQLFVKAHLISRSSSELNMAVLRAQSAAESFRGARGSAEAFAELLDGAADEGGGRFSVYYDGDWEPSTEQAGRYRLLVRLEEGNPACARIDVERLPDDETIFQLQAKEYLPPQA